MKKIGFIDLFLDEWHANNYPKWFREAPNGKDFRIAGAWEKIAGTRPLEEWCRAFDVAPFHSLEKLVEECDAFCVLAPSNPEVHAELGELVLASGKPVFMDKTFSPDAETAVRLFARADQYHTPLFSSSALRFGEELNAAKALFPVSFMQTQGGGSRFCEYAVHQIEMIVAVMGNRIDSLLCERAGRCDHLIFRFDDGRRAAMTLHPKLGFAEELFGASDEYAKIDKCTNAFPHLIEHILQFFEDGVPPVAAQDTIAIMAILETAIRATDNPGTWLPLPQER